MSWSAPLCCGSVKWTRSLAWLRSCVLVPQGMLPGSAYPSTVASVLVALVTFPDLRSRNYSCCEALTHGVGLFWGRGGGEIQLSKQRAVEREMILLRSRHCVESRLQQKSERVTRL